MALSPLIAITVTAVVLLIVIAVRRNHQITAGLTVLGICASLSLLFMVKPLLPLPVTQLLVLDGYALFYQALLFAAGLVTAVLGYGYLEKQRQLREEFYPLLLLATLGAAVLAAARHFASFFLGLEVLSVSLYALSAYTVERERSIEAGVKYLILAALSSAFLLFGMALVYAEAGAMDFGKIAAIASAGRASSPVLWAGLAMIVVAVGFKLGLVPFHLWTPDVYEGAPAPVTAFIATVSKGGVFALAFRFYSGGDPHVNGTLAAAFTVIAVASMFTGTLLALLQENVKRLLAYSSIAHMGYLLVAFLAGGADAIAAGALYLAAYVITTLGAFGVMASMSHGDRDADRIQDYRGLAWKRPWTAAVFTVMMFSLAGLPLTAGFIGKFFIAAAGVRTGLWLPVISLVVTSVIGLFYYLRVVVAVFQPADAAPAGRGTVLDAVLLAGLTAALLFVGIYPGPLITVIERVMVLAR
jgi:NADH-quinone oxidoreductase subunit N